MQIRLLEHLIFYSLLVVIFTPFQAECIDSHSYLDGVATPALDNLGPFIEPPDGETQIIRRTVVLCCKVHYLGKYNVSWIRHPGSHILTVGEQTVTSDKRIDALTYNKRWCVRISVSRESDAGRYECQVSTQPPRSMMFNLKLETPVATIVGDQDIHVEKCGTISLTCTVPHFSGAMRFFWYYNYSKELNDGDARISIFKHRMDATDTLQIRNAQLADSGRYSCIVPAGLMSMIKTEASFMVHVHNGNSIHSSRDCDPNPPPAEPGSTIEYPKNRIFVIGTEAYLPCPKQGTYNVSWIRHPGSHVLTVCDQMVTSDKRFKVYTKYDWSLSLKDLRDSDAGIYECQVSSQPPRSTFANLIVETPVATILGDYNIHVEKGGTINITCMLSNYSETYTSIDWFHDTERIRHIRNERILWLDSIHYAVEYLVIRNAQLTDSGKYYCRQEGAKEASVMVHVHNVSDELTTTMPTASLISDEQTTATLTASLVSDEQTTAMPTVSADLSESQPYVIQI